ncbi:SMP-30/gluconolactonase/LRE family protein [Streptomyces sp. KL116D]|uniref:SMP-30/gluconolactonase/LRE family protein n=1 Tax=Streptomyces sp. KL116D TaxID=3045152 RepID=UPI0035570D3F
MRLVADGFGAPNGLVFSPDESRLYVSDTRSGVIREFDVREDGTLSDGKVFAEMRDGTGGSTTSASTTADACGPPPWTAACTATTRTAPCSAGC